MPTPGARTLFTTKRTDERLLSSDVVERRDERVPRLDLGVWNEPARDLPIYRRCDVLVVGGGPSGPAAAVAAARQGASVVLLERYNHRGGLSTGGLVIWIDRMTGWTRRLVIRGLAREILEQLPDDAVAGAPEDEWGSQDEEEVAHWGGRQGAFRGVVTWSP